MNHIPFIPESAPFTSEQRAYLNGFLAGLFSYSSVSPAGAAVAQAPLALEPVSILFGSQTGNAERLAKQIAKEATKRGFTPNVHDMARYEAAQLPRERNLIVVTSTYGDGEPPDNAKPFWDLLNRDSAPRLNSARFSVCALGDSNYPKFCQFGKEVDARLEELGGTRVSSREDCDVDFEESFAKWLSAALRGLSHGNGSVNGNTPVSQPVEKKGSRTGTEEPQQAAFSKQNPFPARLLVNRALNGEGSAKDVRHCEISIEGSGLSYAAGDALGVFPTNDPRLVNGIISALGFDGEEEVRDKQGNSVSLRMALSRHFEITKIPQALLAALADRTGASDLKKLLPPDAAEQMARFLYGREILDLLQDNPRARFEPREFVGFLRKLQPRLYSVSSSPLVDPNRVHLTVNTVRYESLGRKRSGVCSTFLADRAPQNAPVPVFVHGNKAFRPPSADTPLIMVGPGTGIAPFRAFLQERKAIGGKGKSWLFFGDQHARTDFLYRAEIEQFLAEGTLSRLDLAFSRDQENKIYVQDRMTERAAELFSWLEEGAFFYVCGDASRMAKDVDRALRQIIQKAGGRSADQTCDYVKKLQASKRYQRDVY